jgi:hypothetical protein
MNMRITKVELQEQLAAAHAKIASLERALMTKPVGSGTHLVLIDGIVHRKPSYSDAIAIAREARLAGKAVMMRRAGDNE